MKKSIILTLLLIFSGCIFIACNSGGEFKIGMNVAAKWTDNNYYLATISKVNGEKYSVDYADGTKGEVSLADLKLLTPKEKIKVGDKVFAVWAGAKFYSGKIIEMNEKNAMVIWDDGSAQSEVDYDKIFKIE